MSFQRLVLLILTVLLSAAACKSDNANPTATPTTPESATQNDTKTAPVADAKKTEKVGDIYPGFNFSVLDATEQQRFIDVAKAELCPCPNSTVSLHECLQKLDARCDLAEQSASIVAMRIKEGNNQTDTLAALASFIEASRKKHEFNLKDTPLKGSADAKVIVVEFADFECPHCREFSKILSKTHEKYGDKVGIYYKHFPLSAHSNARLAAQAAIAAHNQKKFWPMHDLVFENQRNLSPERIMGFAAQIGLNMEKFQQDLNSAMTVASLQADRAEGEATQLTGTPTVFINGVKYMGGRTEEDFFKAVDDVLNRAE